MKYHTYFIFFLLVAYATSVKAQSLNKATENLSPLIELLDKIYYNKSGNAVISNHSKISQKQSLDFGQNIVKGLHSEYSSCSRTLEYVCGIEVPEWINPKSLIEEPLKKHLADFERRVKEILIEEMHDIDLKSVTIEKQLYQDCVSNERRELYGQDLVQYVFKHGIQNVSNKTWQTIDEELGLFGFGHTFFNISIRDHPDKPNAKILLLEPPSSVELVRTFGDLEKIMDKVLSLSPQQKEIFIQTMHFFEALDRSIPETNSLEKMSMLEWNNYYYLQTRGPEHSSSKINWFQIFKNMFKTHHVYNIDEENIVVKDKQYFHDLERIIRIFSKSNRDSIANFIAVQWIVKNIDYYVPDPKHDRSSYCMRETNLYGISYQVLLVLNLNQDPLVETARHIIRKIIEIIKLDIMLSQDLLENEKIRLKYYLDDITALLLDVESFKPLMDNLYGDFKVTHDHIFDIRNYQRNIRSVINGSTYINTRSLEKTPFSIFELDQPQNRLALKAYFIMNKLVSPNLHKEFHYGEFGTIMAGYLYDLLINKKFGLYQNYQNDVEWLIPNANYPFRMVTCLERYIDVENINVVMSEALALRTSYEAMMQDYLQDKIVRKPFEFDILIKPRLFSIYNPYLERTTFSPDSMFIIQYLHTHCYWTPELAKTVLLNFKQFPSAFNCQVDHDVPICAIPTF